jgi:hypothetical protein
VTDLSVLVCRGCCCGTDKHPDVDHDGQLAQLEAAGARCHVVDCLGPCDRSNVVVVRRDEARWWFGEVFDAGPLAAWVAQGAAGEPPLPTFEPEPDLVAEQVGVEPDGLARFEVGGVLTILATREDRAEVVDLPPGVALPPGWRPVALRWSP